MDNKITYTGFPLQYKDITRERIRLIMQGPNKEFIFSLMVRQDQHCCGLYSVGSFGYNNEINFSEEEKIQGVKDLFKKLAELVKQDDSEVTLIFTLINNIACNLVKKALEKTELFRCIKTFKNSNSMNINEIYVNI